jgi:hypothetical protein
MPFGIWTIAQNPIKFFAYEPLLNNLLSTDHVLPSLLTQYLGLICYFSP